MKTSTNVLVRFLIVCAATLAACIFTETTVQMVINYLFAGTLTTIFPWVLIFAFVVGFIVWPTLENLPEYPGDNDISHPLE